MTVRIAPSLLNADLGRLREQIADAEAGGAEWIHIDVMDGHFVPNLSFGGPVIRAVRQITDLPIDVHLMVERPEQYVAEYADSGASGFTFHPEATIHVQRQLAFVRERGMRAGLALNPGTPSGVLLEVARDLDLVLVMTVNPGFGGQSYLPGASAKIARVRALMNEWEITGSLEVDGGITVQTIAEAHAAGADTFVVGTAVFGQPDPSEAIRALKRACLTRV
ncbi:MAG TPA: ribulose-phosphate 3-epimerase [Gemmatimonadales bacterium]|jgi:ribulose-phosphate 3-epimerase